MDEFKFIIWHQGRTSTEDSTMILVDKTNKKIELSGSDKMQLFDFLSVSTKTYMGERHIWKELKVSNPNTRLKVYTDNLGNVLISSHFAEYDEDGRKIVFLFSSKRMNWDDIATMLSLAGKEVGKTVQETDLDTIRQIKKRRPLKPLFRISLILILIYIIWKNFLA